jgi:mono/diheme cytochrome c family protein
MKIHRKSVSLLSMGTLILISFLAWATSADPQEPKTKVQASSPRASQLAQGRYLVMMSGCNDCHTHGYLQLEGKVPETDWLTGESVGWYGPWGTTYAINLRLFIHSLTEDAWVNFSRGLKARPAMPWWELREMKEQDLRAIYRFVRSLGPKGQNAPSYLPPDQKPKPPYFEFVLK